MKLVDDAPRQQQQGPAPAVRLNGVNNGNGQVYDTLRTCTTLFTQTNCHFLDDSKQSCRAMVTATVTAMGIATASMVTPSLRTVKAKVMAKRYNFFKTKVHQYCIRSLHRRRA